jgi:hypothetical protein
MPCYALVHLRLLYVLAMYNFLHIHELNLYFVYILNCRSSFQLIGCPYYIASEVLQKCCEQEADVKPTRVVIYVFLSYIAPFEQVSLLFLAVIFKLNYSTESKLIIKYDLFYQTQQGIFYTVPKWHIDFDSDQ